VREVLDHILASVTPASAAQRAAAGERLRRRVPEAEGLGKLVELAGWLAGARHAPRPTVARRTALLVAADHGVADPGIDLGEHAPTIVAVRHVAAGGAAVCAAARSAGAELVVVDAGVRGGERHDLGRGVLGFRQGDGTASIADGPAMTPLTALASLTTGIAVAFSLADAGLDLLALGQIGPGAQPVSGAVIAALAGASPASFGEDGPLIARALAEDPTRGDRPLDVLAGLGGYDLGVLAGAILGAASIHVPVVLDDHATWAAALLAVRLQPDVAGYLVASHAGAAGTTGHRAALEGLGLRPLFDLGLAHGEGTGALLAVPLIDAAARVLAEA
jgi:nicotinate-nucleotide--dimethylbenzimidazole phosphoribosyltransferase